MSLDIDTIYRNYRSYIPSVMDPPLMMAQCREESTSEINNY